MDLVPPPAWAPPWLNALLFAAGCLAALGLAWLPFALLRIGARLRRIEAMLRRAETRPAPPADDLSDRRRVEPFF